jgi:hypothetical protein
LTKTHAFHKYHEFVDGGINKRNWGKIKSKVIIYAKLGNILTGRGRGQGEAPSF